MASQDSGIVFTEWHAVQDRTPGPDTEKRLTVTGRGEARTSGFAATLRYHEPQGIGFPWDLLLDLTVTEPDFGTDVVTPIIVTYEGSTGYDHDTVTILSPNRPIATISVEVIS